MTASKTEKISQNKLSTNSKGEPIWNAPDWEHTKPQRIDIIRALNQYNLIGTKEEAREYLVDYLNLNAKQKSLANKVPLSDFIPIGFLCRMINHGKYTLPEAEQASFDHSINAFKKALSSIVEKKEEQVDNVVDIQAAIRSRASTLYDELDFICQDFIHGDITEFDAYAWLKEKDVKSVHVNHLHRFMTEQLESIRKLFSSRDEYVRESYRFLSAKKKSLIIEFHNAILADMDKFLGNAKATRKPRKKKAPKVEKQVSKMKHKVSDAEYKLQSVNPVNIPGAEQLWVFNTKTRKLGVYTAADASGLSVKGTTINGFSKSSVEKIVRKPEVVLKNVLETGKLGLRKVMDSINAKPANLTGRINKDTILLRVLR